MRVRAVTLGYYDLKRRKPESIFHIQNEKEFSKKWMEKVDEEPSSKKKSRKEEVEIPRVAAFDEDVI